MVSELAFYSLLNYKLEVRKEMKNIIMKISRGHGASELDYGSTAKGNPRISNPRRKSSVCGMAGILLSIYLE
jgi:hypothetical protein